MWKTETEMQTGGVSVNVNLRVFMHICMWNLWVSVCSCEYTSLCMCHHTSFCRGVCTGRSVPKDVPIILSTRPFWWHQMVVTKENLVHHPLFCFWDTHTYTHTSRRTKSIALPWTGLFVHLPVCHFWCMYLYFFTLEREWLTTFWPCSSPSPSPPQWQATEWKSMYPFQQINW